MLSHHTHSDRCTWGIGAKEKRCIRCNQCKLCFAPPRSASHPRGNRARGGPGPENRGFCRFLTDFWVFWQSKHAGGILRGTALTTQSFSPNGGFPTPFVPDSMFSGRILACLTGIYSLYIQPTQLLWLLNSHNMLLWHSNSPCVAATQPLCGFHTDHAVRNGRRGRPGRCAESLEALLAPTHTDTHPRSLPRAAGGTESTRA